MIKSAIREITLAVQAKSGATPAVFVWLAVAALAVLTAFAFLCVAAYDWLEGLFGGVFAGLIVAGCFVLIAGIATLCSAVARNRARQRAILERAERARAGSWLLDPKMLAAAVQAGRSLGWERLVPVALLGFILAQWVRGSRAKRREDDE